MKHKTLWTRALASITLFAITLALPLSAFAAAMPGTFSAAIDKAAAQAPVLVFTPSSGATTLYVNVPDAVSFDLSGATATASGGVAGVMAKTGNTFSIASPTAAQTTITFAGVDASAVTAGDYTFAIWTENASGAVVDNGSAVLHVANTVSITAAIQEALIMTINDTAIEFSVDPSVNNGQDTTQNTVLNVKSNAYSGFSIVAALSGGALTGSTHAQSLTTAADGNGDNYLKWTSAAAGDLSNVNTTNVMSAIQEFGATVLGGAGRVYAAAGGGADLTNTSNVTVSYDLNVDYTTPADTYTGTITYTAYPTF